MATVPKVRWVMLAGVLLVACAPGWNNQIGVADAHGGIAGFWLGLWHGIIAPVTFLVSLFSHNTQMYEVHNNGGWYNFGFLIGISSIHGSGHSAAWSRRRRAAVIVRTE
jgi:hypothetical protein